MQVRVSVIVAAKDEEKRIGRCITSVIDSIGPNDEIIIIDDGSVDRTAQEVAAFESSRVKVLTNIKPMGRAAARNAGIQVARGRYIAIQDADDEALMGRIDIPVSMLERNPELVAASGQCVAVTDRGFAWRHMKYPTDPKRIREYFDDSVMAVCHTGSVIRRSALDQVGLYDPSYVRAQDLDLFKRLAAVGPIENSEEDIIIYTHNAWLDWRYWRLSRFHHDLIAERPPLPKALLALRYIVSMSVRSVRLLVTHFEANASLSKAKRAKR
ncbi:glycosyltransferase involved in cell wall biosynthesis [Pseudarthrobacter oxydans]|uniref:Glycosyltransferase involved in cell wall biosynthesis n=1 Tax=Pseudarthrobacter oxydans TaxID=1671 RepID=A0AAW8N5Y0_PSEOX|nr:glycosyltransferase family 2 protein [Pseudarthrobacter oxydans]MDR6790959.1 glycosyltransferase involved in cell wall biosynthesis [Pseudarthrobacter oxydans]MDR7162612.1 glycosyltransferase involved in cell wall biosynthesis [Pseudarthrobacter oxydans]